MSKHLWQQLRLGLTLLAVALSIAACTASAKNSKYFGKTLVPGKQVMRYVSGSEPESLDPQIATGQPETRLIMAFFDGLTEYDPKTMAPIPALAETWDVNKDSSEFVFHLRHDARWSNNDLITAQDFVYSLRRGLSPELASRAAYMAYYIKYSEGYNEGGVFVRDPRTNEFLLDKDFQAEAPASASGATVTPPIPLTAQPVANNSEFSASVQNPAADTAFHQFIHQPTRLVLPGDEKGRAKETAKNPKLKAALEGKEFVPIKAEDIGVEAIDDYTLRITLVQPAPFFISMMPHQFFRPVPRKAIEKYAEAWTQPANIITSGAFKLESWKPYSEVVGVRNSLYWDAARVKLDEIVFYAVEDSTTMMNLYKAGQIDGMQNHSVPASWLDVIRPLRDYMDAPEAATEYYQINTTKPPMNDKRVRKAFNMAIDKVALAAWRRTSKPLTAFTPEGIFPGYPRPKGDDFDPARAKKLLAEAGYKDAAGNFDPKKFPINQIELSYNPAGANKPVAEFVQAQWKQNLGLTVSLKSIEWKTFLDSRAKLEYKGFARTGWVADYMDPYTYLNLFYTAAGDNGTGWYDPKYVQMLDDANSSPDPQKRYELMAKAEAYMLDAQPVIPLMTNATSWMKKPYVKGMYPNPQTLHAWKFVYIEPDQSKWDQGVPSMAE